VRGPLLLVLVFLLTLPPRAEEPAGAASVDRELQMAEHATRVAEAHERADALAKNRPLEAAGVLRQALAASFPKVPRSRQLRADLFARLAELLLQGGAPRDALAAVRQGLAEDAQGSPDAFTAQLKLREGEALEALGQDGDAVDAFAEAISIAKSLLAGRTHGHEVAP